KAVMLELFPDDGFQSSLERAMDGRWPDIYIDHQSAFKLPDPQHESFPALVREAMEFFMDDRLSIYGGNDNDGSGDGDTPFDEYCPVRIRRDGDCYVIYNWWSGAKIRMAPEGKGFTSASRPELVDLKITNQCPYQCSFCYQSSTPDGKHASRQDIGEVIEALGINGAGVFEVAIGGGEPTAHEYFDGIIRTCVENYIRPNFTTFAVDWLLDDSKVSAANLCGGIGVSVHSEKDLGKVQKIMDRVKGPTVTAQHVFGTVPPEETMQILSRATDRKIPVLLLGYKQVGFGEGGNEIDQRDIVQNWRFKYLEKLRLSVDTAFAEKHQWFLDAVEANKLFVTKTEGAFSMYVDAVTGRLGPSSYCNDDQMVPFTDLRSEIVARFPFAQEAA
ncbi:MAG: radical SAM protein, partial [Anaerolineae bacterium]|nr:radical SAM protein [Anaerolineae bacterium]